MFGSWPDYFYHTNEDTPDKCDPTQLRRAIALGMIAASSIANMDAASAVDLTERMHARALQRMAARSRKGRRYPSRRPARERGLGGGSEYRRSRFRERDRNPRVAPEALPRRKRARTGDGAKDRASQARARIGQEGCQRGLPRAILPPEGRPPGRGPGRPHAGRAGGRPPRSQPSSSFPRPLVRRVRRAQARAQGNALRQSLFRGGGVRDRGLHRRPAKRPRYQERRKRRVRAGPALRCPRIHSGARGGGRDRPLEEGGPISSSARTIPGCAPSYQA